MKISVGTAMVIAVAWLAVAAVPVQAGDKDDAFLVSKKDFKRRFETIALSPVEFDPQLKMPDRVGELLEAEVTRHLKKRGYTVMPSTVLGDIRKTMQEQVGGYNDPETGNVDIEKLRAVRSHAMRELWFRNKPDAIATIRVMANKVPIENDTVEWYGAKQRLETSGGRRKYSANVYVSTVTFAVFDQSDRLLFIYDGGLESLMRRDGDELLPLPVEKYFSDDKRIRNAAKIAVSPI